MDYYVVRCHGRDHGRETMGKSLQDQLLKAGLANNKQAAKARKAQNNKRKQKAAGVAVASESEILAKKAQQEKAERDRELNRKKQQEAEAKAVQAQIRQLVEMNRLEERGEIEFSFTDESLVKTLMLQEKERTQLINGRLAILRLDGNYEIVPRPVADKIAERDESVLVLLNTQSEDDADDDEYADYKIPDDLIW